MVIELNDCRHTRFTRTARRALEYGLAVGIALLCSYWIVQGRW
ncbi:MAG: hypothetical protein WBP79_14970 [Candidatus Acidiferrales bacterium]